MLTNSPVAIGDRKLWRCLQWVDCGCAIDSDPFLWETFRRLPLPIIFNRRTREIYYDNNGTLYHAPWDGLKALTCEFQIIGPYTAGMTNASLEILVHQFGNTESALMISLGTPMGKTLDMQKGFWEYIRSYMNNGPWFDENGNPSDSDRFVKTQLASNLRQSGFLGHTRKVIAEKKPLLTVKTT